MKRIILTLTLVLFTLPILNAQDLPSYVPTEGLVAYYPFNGNANDASGNGNHGTVNGATLANDQNGNDNKAYEFNVNESASWGSPQEEIEIDFSTSMNSNLLSLSAWVNPREKPSPYNDRSHSIFGRWEGGVQNEIFRFVVGNDNALYFQISDGNNNIENYSGGNVPYDSWTHVSAVLNEKNIKLYVNGQKVSDELFVNNINTTGNSDLTIASMPMSNGTWYFFDGHLDEMGYWNRALSEQEIQNLYTSSNGDILLNGTVSAENNQIKNVADPTDAQDAVTKNYVDIKTSEISNSQNFSNNSQIGLTGVVYDFEGNRYETVIMCDGKQWTTQYLNVSHFANGEQIPEVTGNEAWRDLTTPAWCYSYNQDNGRGKIYNGFALTDERGLAPEGWHIATEEEWNDLIDCLGGTEVAGGKLKISGTQYWTSPNIGSGVTGKASNSSGMSLLPDGFREGANGNFYSENEFVSIWNYSNIPDRRPNVNLLNDKAEILKGLTDPYDGAHILLVKD